MEGVEGTGRERERDGKRRGKGGMSRGCWGCWTPHGHTDDKLLFISAVAH